MVATGGLTVVEFYLPCFLSTGQTLMLFEQVSYNHYYMDTSASGQDETNPAL